ncbi:polysaccharide biosynthesis/export family protein [Calycomorphotria hydatis]|uniref:Polysaccharide biosynthesis/export protein n=1 Tax=Calycomorphotria hydatis TaxID=2528027 RepID=A0A517T3F4_9PLAN|nr:polysaccharide biosynthesis/export family protein [Calycomorphotria hydatis]QDT62900.1 Polysaccharide biosynthesis/export protein [Calycomorphotria hydatis]
MTPSKRQHSRRDFRRSSRLFLLLFLLAVGGLVGCKSPYLHDRLPEIACSQVPRELEMVTLPKYRVAPPDILLIEAVQEVRPADEKLVPGDELFIQASNVLPNDPLEDPLTSAFRQINNVYVVQPSGMVDLGPEYGQVLVEGLTFEEAKQAIEQHLQDDAGLVNPKVSVSLADLAGKQQISGEHLIRPDGSVSLGIYGSVPVAGRTLNEVKAAIESHLSQYLTNPEISVDVLAYNSKVIYVITDGGGFGETVIRLPVTGNETVLDAISQVQGLSSVSSKKIWVARPAPSGAEVAQVLDVDWRGITRDGITTTNYQLFPGDRIFIKSDTLIEMDNIISKALAPPERIFGFILLGNGVVRSLGQDNTGPSN